MITRENVVYKQVQDMAPTEKLQLVDLLLTDLDQPDETIDRIWAAEAKKRWAAYKAGPLKTVPYAEVSRLRQRPALSLIASSHPCSTSNPAPGTLSEKP